MKFFLISDNIDTQVGMRLAGIVGVVVHERDEVLAELEKAVADEEVAIVLITEKLVGLCHAEVYDYKLNYQRPLLVTIPDRHSTARITEAIDQYVREAIGIKI